MPTRSDPWPAGTPCWADLSSADVPSSAAFYGAVMNWSFIDTGEEFGHYNIGQVDGHAAAAIGPKQDPNQPTAWTVYLAKQATTAHDNNRDPADQYGLHWAGPVEHVSAASQQSAVDLLVAAQPIDDDGAAASSDVTTS